MLKLFNKKKKDNKGFTLVELVIVVAILAILVGILAPQYTKYVEKSRKAADVSNLENLVTAFKTAAADGEDNVPAGVYVIEVTKDGSKIGTLDAVATAGPYTQKTDGTDAIKGLISSYAGDKWSATTLKSAKWTVNADGTGALQESINAQLEVKNDGSINVSYYPTWIKNLAK